MSSASSSKNQIVPMVWSLIALTLATFTLVMVMTGNAMFQFTEQHEQMDKQHRQLIQASEQIKFQVDQIRNEILQILNNQDSQDLIAKEPQTEKLQEFITVIKHTANSNNLDQLIQDFTRSLQPVHKVWMAAQDWRWRQTDFELTIRYKNALHKMRKTLSHTRSAVDSYEGQLRIKKAIEIRKYYRSGQQQKPLLAQQIIETNTKAADSIVRKFKIDLAELARLTEILNGEQQQHRLASIKDNEFKSTFNRLSHNAAVIPENLSAQLHFSLKNIEALLVAVFGNGYLIDNIHQTIKPGEGGLYQQRYKTLQLRKEQQAINYQLDTVLKPLYINSDKLVDEASKYSAMLMHQEEEALLKSWKTIIVLLILSSIVFLGLAGFLSRQVKKQVYELTNSEQRFQDVVFSTGDWIWEVDAQGLYTFASERIKDILGYSSKEVIGKSPFEMMAEGEAERVGPVFVEQLTNKKPLVDLENWNIAKDGSRVCLLTSGVPMLDDGGNLLGYRGVDKDITERKIAEEELKHHRDHLSEMVEEQTRELRSSEEKTRNILTTAAEGIITIDQRGIITSINPAAEQLFAYSAEEIIGKNISKLMPEKIASQHDAILESYIKSGVSDIMGRSREMLGLRKTGETFPMRLAISETQYDDEIIFTGFIHDLTDEKHFEKQLAEKSRLLEESNTEERTLSNLLRVALQTTNMKEFLNEILNTIFKDIHWLGLDPNGAIFLTTKEGKGQSLHLSVEYNLSEELHSLCARIPFGRCLCGRAAAERTIQFAHCIDERHDTQFDGMQPHGHYSVPLLQNNVLLGVMVFYIPHGNEQSDKAISFLQQVADIVGMGIARRYNQDALVKAKEAAEIAATAKSEFLANMSHEIRTPLNGVLGMLHLLENTELESKQQRFVKTAASSSEMLLTVINDILDFSKIEAGKLELEKIPFYPVTIVEDTIALMAGGAYKKGLELISMLEPGVPEIFFGDPTRLRQVLTNLISNAIKFTEEGEVILQVSRTDGHICFTVIDTGIGLNKKQQASIFKAFSQADTSHTRKYGGTGLGLAISGRLVSAMGGKLQVESQPGYGSQFYFELAIDNIDENPVQGKTSEQLSQQRILIVDDNLASQIAIRNILQNWQVSKIGLAGNGEDALAQLKTAKVNEQAYDIVIIDMQMPGMDGLTLAQAIRSDSNINKTHLLMLTTGDHPASAHEIENWVIKPVRQNDLYNSLLVLTGEVNDFDLFFDDEMNPESESIWFGGRKLLLVEDNETNQEVAEAILAEAGFEITICENGAEAVAAVSTDIYDIVLMDIQMPVMDGIEATKQIRALGDRFTDLPIIAMTAHALTGDSDKSLKAGMNAHITKPINPDELLQTLGQWVATGEKPQPDIGQQSGEQKQSDNDVAPELPGIDITSGLERVVGNWSAYKKILTGFRNKQLNSGERLAELINNSEWQQATTLAHTLKGSGGNISANKIYESAAKMEQACKAENQQQAFDLLGDLRSHLDEVINGLAILEEKKTTKENLQAVTNHETLIGFLTDIESYLETDISEALDVLASMESEVDGTELKPDFDSLEEMLNSFDTESAKEIIHQMKQKLK